METLIIIGLIALLVWMWILQGPTPASAAPAPVRTSIRPPLEEIDPKRGNTINNLFSLLGHFAFVLVLWLIWEFLNSRRDEPSDMDTDTKVYFIIGGTLLSAWWSLIKLDTGVIALALWLATRQTPEKWPSLPVEALTGTEGYILRGPGIGDVRLWDWKTFNGKKFTKAVGDETPFPVQLGTLEVPDPTNPAAVKKKPYNVFVYFNVTGRFANWRFLDYDSLAEALAAVIVPIVTCIRNTCLYMLGNQNDPNRAIQDPAYIMDNKDKLQDYVLKQLLDHDNPATIAVEDTGFVINPQGLQIRKILPDPSIMKAAEEAAQSAFQRAGLKDVSASIAEMTVEIRKAIGGDPNSTIAGMVAAVLAQVGRAGALGEWGGRGGAR